MDNEHLSAETKLDTPATRAQEFADEYVERYQLEADEGTYTPNETEQMLIADAVNGLIADEEFCDLVAMEVVVRQARRIAAGDCLGCGAPAGEHWGTCDGKPAVDFVAATPPSAHQWRPMTTAPHDESYVLLGMFTDKKDSHQEVGCWDAFKTCWKIYGEWIQYGHYFQPTHWMPLPAAPGAANETPAPLSETPCQCGCLHEHCAEDLKRGYGRCCSLCVHVHDEG